MIIRLIKKLIRRKRKSAITLPELSNDNFELVYRDIEKCIDDGSYDIAIKYIAKIIEKTPNNPYIWGYKALIFYKLKRYEEALKCYEKSLEYSPNEPITWYNKGLTLIRLNKLYDAIVAFDMAIKLKPDYAKAYYNKGRILASLKETDKAQEYLDIAKKLDPLLFVKLKGE